MDHICEEERRVSGAESATSNYNINLESCNLN